MQSPWFRILTPLKEVLGQPLVAHVVANGVRGDSRVLKSAQTSLAEGYESLIIGISLAGTFEAFYIEGVPVLLIPVGEGTETEPRTAPTLPDFARDWQHRSLPLEIRRALRKVREQPPRAWMHLTEGVRRLYRARGDGEMLPAWSRHRNTTGPIVSAFAEALSVLKPRLVHVHDVVPLPAAVVYSAAERVSRRYVWTIYDAHESASKLVESNPASPYFRMMAEIEAEFIHDANDVITVSKPIANLLKETYRLRRSPGVVTNAPSKDRITSAPSIRQIAGVPEDVPLAVYSGWVSRERGLDTVVRALPSVRGLHVAIVCASLTPEALRIYDLARQVGVQARIHFVSYVAPAQVTQYLSSATLGLIPHKAGVHLDLSLPTKYREYLHAGLPLVVSSNRYMEAETKRTGVGRVFRSGNVGGLALQLNRVLENPERYRRKITPALLDLHSWEAQSGILAARYRNALKGLPAIARDGGKLTIALADVGSAPTESLTMPEPPRRFDPAWASVQLGIGPSNSASQAYLWSEATAKIASLKAESFAPQRALNETAHRVVPRLGPRTHAASARELGVVVGRYTHLLVDGFARLFGTLIGDTLQQEIEFLSRHGLHVGLIAHGSDVRDPDRHMDRLRGSYFRNAPDEWVNLLREISVNNRNLATSYGGSTFVSTPDLLLDLPDATWLPLVVDYQRWSGLGNQRPAGAVPRVLHRPSRSDPPIKGTHIIMPVLERLEAEGLIALVRADEAIPHSQMPALVAQSDIVVDQICTGSYGAAAVEAMAAGRVVVGHVAADVRALVPDAVPIVDAEPSNFEGAMRALLSRPDEMETLARDGQVFAASWHDGKRAAATIRSFVEATLSADQLLT